MLLICHRPLYSIIFLDTIGKDAKIPEKIYKNYHLSKKIKKTTSYKDILEFIYYTSLKLKACLSTIINRGERDGKVK